MSYSKKSLASNEKIDVNDGTTIYYFVNYYQWEKVKNLPEDDKRRHYHDMIFSLSKNGSRKHYRYFINCIKSHFEDFKDSDWVVCTIPSHDQTKAISNNMDRFLTEVCFPQNIRPIAGIILRNKIMPEKHGDNYGERTIEKDLDSFTGDTRNIIDRNFIIFDDITTTGCSLEAASIFLKRRGANKIVCIALSKTVEDYYYAGNIDNLF